MKFKFLIVLLCITLVFETLEVLTATNSEGILQIWRNKIKEVCLKN